MKRKAIIIAILVALLFLAGCSSKESRVETTRYKLDYISEELRSMEDTAFYAKGSDDYDQMDEALSELYGRIKDLRKEVDDLAFLYRERSVD